MVSVDGTLPRFVVGTGRCGSTLLSRMLATHRDVASIHEFFTGLDWGRRFAVGDVSAVAVEDLLTAPQDVTTRLIAMGYRAPEVTYPFERPGMRWTPGEPVPWLLVSMITWLTEDERSRFHEDPDGLYDALVTRLRELPDQSMAAHYRVLLDWLARAAGRTVWVERSGSSIDYVGELATLFPGARFCHLHRDGAEAAMSLRAHKFFRLAMALLFDLFPTDLQVADGDDEPLIRWVVEHAPPVEVAGRYWCDQVLQGYSALAGLDADQWLDVRFEDLVTEPAPVLERLAVFFELPDDPEFVDRASALVTGVPPSRLEELTDVEREALAAAIRPGQVLLGRA